MRKMILAEIIVYAIGIYLLIGVLFAAWFAARGVFKLDEAARWTTLGFRFIVFFGAAALWLLLARRLVKGVQRPVERTAHRQRAER